MKFKRKIACILLGTFLLALPNAIRVNADAPDNPNQVPSSMDFDTSVDSEKAAEDSVKSTSTLMPHEEIEAQDQTKINVYYLNESVVAMSQSDRIVKTDDSESDAIFVNMNKISSSSDDDLPHSTGHVDIHHPAPQTNYSSQLANDFTNGKYIVIYGSNLNTYNQSSFYKLVGVEAYTVNEVPVDDTAKQLDAKLVAVGIMKSQSGAIICDTFYNASDDNTDLSLNTNIDTVIDKAAKSIEDAKTGKYTGTVEYIRSKTINYGTYGKLQLTCDMIRRAYNANYNGKAVSIWDIIQTNTTIAGYSLYKPSYWDVDYLYCNVNVEPCRTEQIIQHGPTSTPRYGTASINLSLSGPSFSYSWNVGGVNIVDNANPPKVQRWTFDYKRHDTPARHAYVTYPSVRIANGTGAFYVYLSHKTTFWDEKQRYSIYKYTGVYYYAWSDR